MGAHYRWVACASEEVLDLLGDDTSRTFCPTVETVFPPWRSFDVFGVMLVGVVLTRGSGGGVSVRILSSPRRSELSVGRDIRSEDRPR